MEKRGWVYILRSKRNNTYYIGSTNDRIRRLEEHNRRHVRATRYLVPWEMVFSKEYGTLSTARKVEYKLKKLKSRIIIERILKEGVIKLTGT